MCKIIAEAFWISASLEVLSALKSTQTGAAEYQSPEKLWWILRGGLGATFDESLHVAHHPTPTPSLNTKPRFFGVGGALGNLGFSKIQ